MQDIEKLATKKGVISQSVKEVLQVTLLCGMSIRKRLQPHVCSMHRCHVFCPMQSLVDDDMVHQDKIGISNFFW